MSSGSRMAQAVALGSYFLSGCLAINTSQVLGSPLYLVNEDWYNAWISFTKQSFNLLTITLTQWWAPTMVKVSGDPSMRGQLFLAADGTLLCNFPERLVMIANHQIYTDWLYLWWIAYCGGAAGRIYIILKESLRRIPVIGWGIQLSQFIFLKRNWEKDKPHLSRHLQKLNNASDPMWLLMFPEGTNLAPSTRASSKRWADKNGIKDMQHTLLPRSTGLQFCLQELRGTVGYLYDCTIAYEGVPRGQYAQDIYSLQAQYLQGKPPKMVHMYWRRFRISDIPIDNTKSFESWLRARWIEKDAFIEHFYRVGQFPCDTETTTTPDGRKRKGCGYIDTTIKATQWHEFLQVFAPIGLVSLVLYVFYGQLPRDFVNAVNGLGKKAVMDKAKSFGQSLGAVQKTISTYPGGPTITFNSDKISSKEATAIMHKAAKQLTLQKPGQLNTVLPYNASTPDLRDLTSVTKRPALSTSALTRHSSSQSATSSSRVQTVPSSASSTGWETLSYITTSTAPTSVSGKPPKLGPSKLQSKPATVASTRAPSVVSTRPSVVSNRPVAAKRPQSTPKPSASAPKPVSGTTNKGPVVGAKKPGGTAKATGSATGTASAKSIKPTKPAAAATKPTAKAQSHAKPKVQVKTTSETPAPKLISTPAKKVKKPVVKAAAKPNPKPISKPSSKPIVKPVLKPAPKPAPKPITQKPAASK